ncbi:hypothetical protein [Schumannella sp. 10F1B-5-1]|uniref:hypothetical protein n=1 Tax=Schumannella sp. 10F1B-5-1 TaxID=2590780 RepID=UPI0011327D0E|nr:hypothetical protein [Schumannella sp. 10F1B-5-1]TPW70956.1 hypothetical protein FJ658_12715 [Schumannella sp. 10F1B-5-1]
MLPIPLAIGLLLTAGILFATLLVASTALNRGGMREPVRRAVLIPIGVVSLAVVVVLAVVSFL